MKTSSERYADRAVFGLSCLFAAGVAVISWAFAVLLHGAAPLEMTIQCLLFLLVAAAVTWPRRNGQTLFLRWMRWSRRARWHFALAPAFLMLACSLLRPYGLPSNPEAWLWNAVAIAISYSVLLLVLYVTGWDGNSPDLLEKLAKRADRED